MLSRANRIVDSGDFRQLVRRGDKCVTNHLIGYRIAAPTTRVGIIVTSKCGNAVTRNTIRRRTRAIASTLISDGSLHGDIVFRFRCEGAVPDFATLQTEIGECLRKWATQ